MNLNIYQGETVALIGAIGSGKTTLIDLILKFYKVDDNRIFIDGIDINRIDTTSLRNNISYITQETVLFSQSIAENIKFGKQDASFNEIIDAAIVSNFHSEIINFEKDYKTVLGEKGVNLSGGQRQRLSIARSIIKNSPILIIDDALSAVDKETENELMKNLKEIRSNKTTILITHRVASVQFADKIFILEKGRNLVSGTHNELISSSKYYQDLYAESADEVKNHE
jgi:ATP-binding cassette subfamily B protein